MTEQALWISTTNKNKLNEFRNIIGQRVDIHSVAEISSYFAPPKTEKRLRKTRIKAKTLKAIKPGVWVVADDSGLEVEGLGGLPGFILPDTPAKKFPDGENVAKLLKMLQIRSPGNRKAQFKCVLVAYDPAGNEHVIEGAVSGTISTTARGQGGFGYDPVFMPEGNDKTFSELGPAFKNQISHRAKAIREFMLLIERFTQ